MPYEEQPGVFTPYNVLFATQGVWRHTVGMTSEFFGDEVSGTRRRVARSLGRYATGRPLDQQTARRLTGQSFMGKKYGALKDRGMRGLPPNLSYLGPSRYMTLWAGLAGHEGAGAGLAAMQAANDVARYYGDFGADVFGRAGGKQAFGNMTAYDLKKATRTRGAFFDARVARVEAYDTEGMLNPGSVHSRGPIGGTWGDYVESDSTVRYKIRGLQQRLAGGDVAAGKRLAAITGGDIAGGGLYQAWGNFLSKKIAGGSAFYIGMGKALPSVARLGAAGFMGVDLFTIGSMAGSLMGKAAISAMKAPVTAYNTMTADIHRGTFMSTSPLSPFVGATQRQRAMANIYDRQLNLRQVLGNEAAYFSRL